jgi:hypothetical protein
MNSVQIGPVVTHSLVQLTAGDSWEFDAILNDTDGNPLDLTNATIVWSILNFNQVPALGTTDFTMQLGTGPGQCSVLVPSASSTKLATGSYTDFWRVTLDGVTQVLIQGPMRVRGDPFVAPHSWDFKGMNVSTGIKPADTLQAMAQRHQVKAVYDFTNGGSTNG